MCPYIHSVHTLAVQGTMLSVPVKRLATDLYLMRFGWTWLV
jgi:hypothetical protein